jgi:hypothetical protein
MGISVTVVPQLGCVDDRQAVVSIEGWQSGAVAAANVAERTFDLLDNGLRRL